MDEFAEYIREKKKAFDQYIEVKRAAGSAIKWRVRLRIRLGDRLSDETRLIKAKFHGRVVTIKPSNAALNFREDNWIVLTACRFATADEAAEFGSALQSALAIGGAVSGVGMDVGVENTATVRVGEVIKEAIAKAGQFWLDEVHGINVYPDAPVVLTSFGKLKASVLRSSDRLIEIMRQAPSRSGRVSHRTLTAALMMNGGLMASHPAAALALYVGAVELLAAEEKWSVAQLAWIKHAPSYLATATDLSDTEKAELQAGILGMLNFGVSIKVRRLIEQLGLSDIRQRWDELYSKRSKFLHGAQYMSYRDLLNMQSDAKELASLIVSAHVQKLAKK
nr:hypothetical protein [Methylobacterium sp. ZNC0032]